MKLQHQELANGQWKKMPLAEQMANVGSEVERAIKWKEKGNQEYSQKAFERALELLALTKNSSQRQSVLKELSRLYEALIDYFKGDNSFSSSDQLWRKYFNGFTYLSAKRRLR